MRQEKIDNALQRVEMWEERVNIGDVFADLVCGAFVFVLILDITNRLFNRLAFLGALRPDTELFSLAALWLVIACIGYWGFAWPCYTRWMFYSHRAIHLRIKGSPLDVMAVLGMIKPTQDDKDGAANGLPFFFYIYTDWQFKKTNTQGQRDGNVIACDVYGRKRK